MLHALIDRVESDSGQASHMQPPEAGVQPVNTSNMTMYKDMVSVMLWLYYAGRALRPKLRHWRLVTSKLQGRLTAAKSA